MCNILILKPYVMPLREKFENMCYNNWHSWGLVTKIDGKLEVVRCVPESGEIDAEEIDKIWNILNRDQEFERILHVRHTTAGATNLNNCHPYDTFFDTSNGREIFFMHNGTLEDYKSKKLVQNTMGGYTSEDDPTGPSDTKNFVDRVITPMLTAMNFGKGHGDISDELFKMLLRKAWPYNNRGILIANDQDNCLLGEWKKVKGQDDKEILSANDTYFGDVIRGPENDRRKERERKAREEERRRASPNTTGTNIVPLAQHNFNKHSIYCLSTTLDEVVEDWNLWEREYAVYLGAAAVEELEQLYNHKEECIAVMDWTFADYYQLYQEYLDLEEKHKRQADYLNQIHGKLREAGIEKDILELDNDALRNMVAANTKAA